MCHDQAHELLRLTQKRQPQDPQHLMDVPPLFIYVLALHGSDCRQQNEDPSYTELCFCHYINNSWKLGFSRGHCHSVPNLSDL